MLYKRSQIWLCTLFSPLSWPLDCAIARALKELVGSSYKSLTATMFPNSMSLCDNLKYLTYQRRLCLIQVVHKSQCSPIHMWKIPITYTFNPIYILHRVITVLNMSSMGFEVLNIGLIHENPRPLSLLLTHVDKYIGDGIE